MNNDKEMKLLDIEFHIGTEKCNAKFYLPIDADPRSTNYSGHIIGLIDLENTCENLGYSIKIYYKCPECNTYSVLAESQYIGEQVGDITTVKCVSCGWSDAH